MTLLLHTLPREHPVNHAEPIWSIAKDRHTTTRYTRQGNKKNMIIRNRTTKISGEPMVV